MQHDTPTSTWSQDQQEAPHQTEPPRQGMLLAGRFRLGEPLGSGATGEVWSALDTQVGRTVALKILRPELRDDASRERLRREARAATSGHTNIIAIHDLHETEGHLFLSMEHVAGRSLKHILRDEPTLPVDQVISIGRDISSALAHLHQQGLVHRDVKPGNILITADGTAKLCDLGLSRPLAPGGTLTETQMVVGTPAYMAPEQGRAGELSTAADIYALGLTLYKALTDQVPLHADSAMETLMARMEQRPAPARQDRSDCPRWLNRLLRSMLEPHPKDRPTADDVIRGLDRHQWQWLTHRSVVRTTTALVCALGLFGAIHWWLEATGEQPLREPVDYRVINQANGTTLEILDAGGKALGTLRTDSTWYSEEWQRRRGVALATFADLDGDGSREIVFADSAAPPESTLTLWRPGSDGELELLRSLAVRAEYQYQETRFADFRARHVGSADLTGDGRDEIVMVLLSVPLYPTLIRVMDGQGNTLTDLWHPGYLARTFFADGDGDGILDLYAAGTCNFIADDPGNESTPVILRVSVDWADPPSTIDLFGPERSLPPAVPNGVQLVYANVGKVRLPDYARAWEMLFFSSSIKAGVPLRLHTVASEVKQQVGTGVNLSYLRGFSFDGKLGLVGSSWQVDPLRLIGHSPSEPELQRFLQVSYWNGSGWQREWTVVSTRP